MLHQALLLLGACTNTSNEGEETDENQTSEESSPTNTSASSDAGAGDKDSVTLEEMDDFQVGDSQDTQSLIHSFIPHESKNTPVVMVAGLGLVANIYEKALQIIVMAGPMIFRKPAIF
ncbi:hypothetical protein ACFQMN_16295 [Halobacillus campisalis]|uniref:Uncharacterized protein n=1 Tax=Halobacillus campisalis TaxID=435909 RepID=A0ABW2K8R4_9BACI|nr:hypothetical protein [Halobacillus campisalis]